MTIAPHGTSRTTGVSLHRQVYLVLTDEIERGVLPPGSLLPREEDLCQRFQVSRITVRRALADMAAQGLVERRQGVGNFVPANLQKPRIQPSLNFIEQLRRTIIDTKVEVLSVEQVTPPPDIASSLGLTSGANAVHAVRTRCIGDTVVMVTDAWVPAELGKRMTAAALRRHALYEILAAQVKLGRVIQEVTAITADPVRARLLGAEVGSPLLKIVRLMHSQGDEQPVAHLAIYVRPDRSRLIMDLRSDQIDTLSAGQIIHEPRE